MAEAEITQIQREFHELNGAVEILDIIREEMEQWLEEAQDDSKHEALENVLGHIELLEIEYKKRKTNLQNSL